jgi:hypothetical protein
VSIDPAVYSPYEAAIPDRQYRATVPGSPPSDVIAAFEDGLVNVTRRVEVYEYDAETLWNPSPELDPEFKRIIDGNINVDYGADERRTLDLTLDNSDLLLKPRSQDGLWYDKIVKVFRGISYVAGAVPPKVVIAEAPSINEGKLFKKFLSTLGYTDIEVMRDASTVDDLRPYSVIFAFTRNDASTKTALYKQMWNLGHHVFTIGTGTPITDTPHYFSSTTVGSGAWRIEPTPGDTPVSDTFASGPGGTGAGVVPLSAAVGVLTLARGQHPIDLTPSITAAMVTSTNGSYWVDTHLPAYDNTQPKLFFRAISDWIRGIGLEVEWETQMGEFMIDGISWGHFPDQVKITGRDYTKKMKLSKLSNISTFVVGTKLRDLVIALAANSGIDSNRMRIGIGGETLGTEMTYEAGTERWQIAKEACESHNYEIFFDQFGYLVVRKFLDPYAGPISWVFKTGEEGNLVTFDKSVVDAEIYNHIVVIATPSEGDAVLPYYGEAKNEDPKSPTNIQRIGQRTMPPIEADYLSSDDECRDLARARLKIAALEQYALNTTTIYYPWLEVGEIAQYIDPDASEDEPFRYLLDSLGFPLGLGAMSGTAKRVILVDPDAKPDPDAPVPGEDPPPPADPDDPTDPPPTPGSGTYPAASTYPGTTVYPSSS